MIIVEETENDVKTIDLETVDFDRLIVEVALKGHVPRYADTYLWCIIAALKELPKVVFDRVMEKLEKKINE